MAHSAKQFWIACKKANRIVARGHRRRTGCVDASIGRPKPVEAAERGRHADRSCRVGAESEVAHGSGSRRSRTARRAAGHVLWRASVDRLAVVNIGAEYAVEELVTHGDAGARCAYVEQLRDRRR